MPIILIIFLCATCSAWAEDPISEYMQSRPWATHDAVRIVQKETPDVYIFVSYSKEGVVTDRNTFGIRFKPKTEDFDEVITGFGVSRDSFGLKGKWCNGRSDLQTAEKSSFTLNFNLSWGDNQGKTGEFKKTLKLPWREKQTFEEDGFKITIEVARPK